MTQEIKKLLVDAIDEIEEGIEDHEDGSSPEVDTEATLSSIAKSDEPRLECFEARIIALDEEKRQVKHVISTGKLDRGDRIVDVGGWKLARFKKNPVVLADHDYAIERIIGRAVETKVEGDALVSTTQFAEDGLGNIAFRLVQAGLAKAWSVGWIGLKTHRIGELEDCEACKAAGAVQWGTHFVRQELLEYSLVAVPANPDAVLGLEAAGLVAKAETEEWAELTADIPRRSSEFYDKLYSAKRAQALRVAARRASQRIRRIGNG